MMIYSQNVRGLKSEQRPEELFCVLRQKNIFAACIQETWRSGIETLEFEEFRLVLASLEPAQVVGNRSSKGVGIALSAEATEAWKKA